MAAGHLRRTRPLGISGLTPGGATRTRRLSMTRHVAFLGRTLCAACSRRRRHAGATRMTRGIAMMMRMRTPGRGRAEQAGSTLAARTSTCRPRGHSPSSASGSRCGRGERGGYGKGGGGGGCGIGVAGGRGDRFWFSAGPVSTMQSPSQPDHSKARGSLTPLCSLLCTPHTLPLPHPHTLWAPMMLAGACAHTFVAAPAPTPPPPPGSLCW